jgi:transcription termination factor Rho
MIQKPNTNTGLVDAPSFTVESSAPATTEPLAPAPRKRGRPRKNPLPDETAKGGGASADGVKSAAAAANPPAASAASTPAASAAPASTPASTPAAPSFDVAAATPATPATPPAPAPSFAPPAPATTGRTPRAGRGANLSNNGNGGRSNGGSGSRSNNSGGQGNSNNGASGGKGKNNYQNQNQNQNQNYGRRPRRSYNNAPREQVAPQASREELETLKVAELREKAVELELDISVIKKKDALIEAVLDAMVKAEGFVGCEGILDLLPEGYGFLRTSGYLPGESDVYVGMSMVRRNGLRKGDLVVGQVRPARENEKYSALHRIDAVNGLALEEARNRRRFADLTPVYPDERLLMEHGINTITARTIDLVAPIGKGQRGLIVSPPKAGKTTILKDIAAAISANNPDVHLMCLLVDERPEEVTDMERSIKGEVVSSTFDMPSENHIAVAELVIERAKRLVEVGRDVVILLDSITRLARAYNLAQPASGRILSGGVDSTALYPPKRFLGAARNIEDGGSLTILASALIETGSKMDEVIFEEFKGTGNMELRLDRDLADRRIFPAIDPVASGTRKEDLLLDAQEAPLIWAVRRILANMNNTERAMEMLIKSLKQTQNNAEFLMRTAKKAQQRSNVEIAEL